LDTIMATTIKPGSNVTVKVVKAPTNAAATKTIVRILSKDTAVMKENKRQKQIRKRLYAPKPRGGRTYGGFIVKQHPVKGVIGEQGVVFASLDVVRDLQSVERFVEVTPA
jgi:hypothetical protein